MFLNPRTSLPLALVLLAGCDTLPEGLDSGTTLDDLVSEGGLAGFATDWTDPATPYTATLMVTDRYGASIAGAEAVVNGKHYSASGSTVTIPDLTVGTVPQAMVRAPGYVPSGLTLDPTRTSGMMVIKLIEATTTVEFGATAGGELAMSGGGVTFSGGGFVTSTGAAYTGTVTAAGRALDPDTDFFDETGSALSLPEGLLTELYLPTVTDAGALSPSIPLAAVDVSLSDGSGGELELDGSAPATVSFGMSSMFSSLFPGEYSAGASLPISSRDPESGAWSTSGNCTVANADGAWTCTGTVPHFSTAAVTTSTTLGCVVARDIRVSHAADRSLVARQHAVVSGSSGSYPNYKAATFLFQEDGKLGACAVVPLDSTGWQLKGTFQLGELGDPVVETPDLDRVTSTWLNLSAPVAADVTGLDSAALQTAAGCQQACAGVAGDSLEYVLQSVEVTDTAFEVPEPYEEPVPEGMEADEDGDGDLAYSDCDDSDAGIHHDADELCDGIDEDCDGVADNGFPDSDEDGIADCLDGGSEDADGDGDPDSTDCAPEDDTIHHGETETCDGIDQDCDDLVDNGFSDGDGDATADCVDTDDDDDGDPDSTDCEPTDSTIYTGASDVCDDGVDGDCGGDAASETTDGDGDGLMDACDAHPTAGCDCFTLSEVEAALAVSGAACLRADSSGTVPSVDPYDGVYRDLGSGLLDIAGVGVSGSDYLCGYGCLAGPSSTASCSDIGMSDLLMSFPDVDGYSACLDLVSAVCP